MLAFVVAGSLVATGPMTSVTSEAAFGLCLTDTAGLLFCCCLLPQA